MSLIFICQFTHKFLCMFFFIIIIFLQVCKGEGGCGSIQVCMGGGGSVMKVMKVMKKVFLNIVGDVVNNYGENGTRTRS